jgi:hypothetical protein
MMDEWRGYMNWPLVESWRCETCGSSGPLIWGLQHGICRCDVCHTHYDMRDKNESRVETPICLLKPEYNLAARVGWEHLRIPLDKFDDEQWDYALRAAQAQSEEQAAAQHAERIAQALAVLDLVERRSADSGACLLCGQPLAGAAAHAADCPLAVEP